MNKIGLIFNPISQGRFDWCQGPQVLLFQDFIRVYFSTRLREGEYFYSDVSFFDYDLKINRVTNLAKHPILDRSNIGTFDYDGVFPLNVFRDPLSNRIYGFSCGWKRKVSVDIDMSIGLLESPDSGETFLRVGEGPILTSNVREPFLIGDPFVCRLNDEYMMFYIRGENWLEAASGKPERQYLIASAKSKDLITWDRDGKSIIPQRLDFEAQAMPSLLFVDGIYHLIYCFRNVFDFRANSSNSYRIGHAYSKDLKKWFLSDFHIPLGELGEWDSEMQCYPQIFAACGKIYIIYNGNSFGRFGIGLVELDQGELNEYARF